MFTTILVASDGSDSADRVAAVARSLARDGRSKVVVAHINKLMAMRGGSFPMAADEDVLQMKVRNQVADLKLAGVDAELKVQTTFGETAPALAQVAREYRADLIVTGASRHGRLASLVMHTVGQRMPRLAPCPVLVLPPLN
jgi:nucleotide-binding universal stress UspA family protein